MSLIVKICGLKTADAIDAALDAGADMLGFVFFRPSPRHLDGETARRLGAAVRGAAKVALSVDATDVELADMVEALKPDVLQLHGSESPERLRAIKARFGIPLMKAIPVSTAADVGAAAAFVGIADHLLFDARAPKDATRPGGLGQSFDWMLLKDAPTPFMLSGGLDPTNVAAALRVTRAAAVDVSSGVERAPGEKDLDKIRAFVRAAREAEAILSSAA
jgi:phosphoribosylanthranilate isomerase